MSVSVSEMNQFLVFLGIMVVLFAFFMSIMFFLHISQKNKIEDELAFE